MKWFPGRIQHVNRNGTCDIRYEDGDVEEGVTPSLIRRSGEDSLGKNDTKKPKADVFEEGDKVEARFRGDSKWFPGRIKRVNRNGTYDVRYEDGDTDEGIDPSFIRRPGTGADDGLKKREDTDKRKIDAFEEGDKVEARFRGGAKWFPGRVKRVNRNGSYDIRYEDGDTEEGMDASMIRRPGGSAVDDNKAKADVFEEGDKVEARFHGGAKWFAGRIQRVNRNGSYDIRYEDGDIEQGVEASMIRRLGATVGDSPKRKDDGKKLKDDVFEEGDKVEARFRGGAKWFSGRIKRVNRNGSYDIRYDDGDTEEGVDSSMIRRPGFGADEDTKKKDDGKRLTVVFEEGDKIEARFRGGTKWFTGRIKGVNRNGTYDIRYEDGDTEEGVDSSFIRRPGTDAGDTKKIKADVFEEGDNVEARFSGRSKWFPGRIKRVNRNGTYDIRYEDGDTEEGVDASMVRRPGGVESGSSKKDDDSKKAKPDVFEEGDKVEARFRGGAKWFQGRIKRVNRNGTYDIRYEDGDTEEGVDASMIRRPGGSTIDDKKTKADGYDEGDKVEARFRGGAKWFPGRIKRVNRNGSYNIRYEDGDTEEGVDASMIRRPGGDKDDGLKKKGDSDKLKLDVFKEGDKIEARFRRGTKWFPGRIQRVNRNGTYVIRYEDGDTEEDVEASMIRRPGSGAGDDKKPKADTFEEGDKVEARFRGGAKWFPGRIKRMNRNGSYDIRYEDGDTEGGVDVSMIRRPGGSSSPKKEEDIKKTKPDVFEEGDKVEARFRGGAKWFQGRIKRVNRNGTYDIRYEDGDTEEGVDASMIRRPGGSTIDDKKAKADVFEEGDKVEARFRGGAKWFPGRIKRVNQNGSYNIRYEDGDTEEGVEASMVRRPGADEGLKKTKADVFQEGDKVEARFRGGAKWFSGRIQRVNRNGTYVIRYEDGDTEEDVDVSMVRRAGSGSSDDKKAKPDVFEEEDKVEARFRGGAKWFSGRIKRVNRNGSYDIRYEDGDTEEGVDASMIRRPGSVMESEKKVKADVFEEGDKVEARFRGGSKWFSGRIRRVNRNGTYDIRYEDGDTEEGVDASMIRRSGSGESTSPRKNDNDGKKSKVDDVLEEGDKVEARFRGGSKWFPGRIKRVNRNGTYDIRYEDGDTEEGVDPSIVRRPEGAKGDDNKKMKADAFEEGDKVEARFRGGTKWFQGRIKRVNRNGSYDIRYEDGDTEESVDASMIRRPRSSAGDDKKVKVEVFEEGDKVEARFRGGTKWFAGRIKRVGRNGSYDIRYEDGDTEEGVDASMVRRAGASVDDEKKDKAGVFDEGDKIEARFRGGTKWFPGRIQRVNRNGTYVIRYEDGDTEEDVGASMIRRAGGGAGDDKNTKASVLEEGDKVEARFRGGAKWFRGRIMRVNRNGSYDIRYEDGDTEEGVDAPMVRRPGGSSSPKREEDIKKAKADVFEEGDKVEARFRGRSKWFPGHIKRVNRNGTYDIRYEDGDTEEGVDASLIRRPEDVKDDIKKAKQDVFEEGDKVEARFRGGAKWFPGRIKRINRNGTYDIRYEDGDTEEGVDASMVRRPGGSSSPKKEDDIKKAKADVFEEGDKVEARFRGRSKWFPGRIKRVNRDGTYDVKYEDGDTEEGVDVSMIRRPEGAKEDEKKAKQDVFEEGDKVEARFRGGPKWFPGRIQLVNRNGTYVIRYEDGDTEKDVDASMIRRDESGAGVDKKAKSDVFEEGDKVEARFRGGPKWFSGRIKQVNRNGSYDIRYEDGDMEEGVDASMVRRPGDSKSPKEKDEDSKKTKADTFEEGDKVEARFRGGTKWFPGRIQRVNRNGTYVIRYEDGDTEEDVESSFVRRQGGGDDDRKSKRDNFEEGDKIEARFRGGPKWFPGRIQRVNRNGTYDIKYQDGDTEDGVEASMVRRPGDDEPKKHSDVFEEGDKVEARFRGRSKWFPGRIKRVNRNGTYDIKYEDGDTEEGVDPSMVRRPGSSGNDEPGKRDAGNKSKSVGFEEGDKVEARFRGRSKWFAGRIKRVNRNGTYDIRYEDGDTEEGVEESMIRRPGGDEDDKSKGSKADVFEEGDKVEARFRGRSKWFPGRIKRVNRNGTYDIKYEDGDTEEDVDPSLVRRPGSSKEDEPKGKDDNKKSKDDVFEEGDKVEARFRGRSKWFPGRIKRVNRNGSYDIKYEDGDTEEGVDPSMVRKPGGIEDDSPRKSNDKKSKADVFEEGDKVEARFRGRSKWFPGRIKKVNRDGSYDIKYEDGDTEEKVDPSMVRQPGSDEIKEDDNKKSKKDVFEEGDKVEARFRGRAKWFPGRIKRVNRNGTYDIKYEDGDTEEVVDPSLVRRPGSSKDDDPKKADKDIFEEGDKVEARFRGRAKWFLGRIKKINRNGTYDIKYEDGDSEEGVDPSLVRRPGSGKDDDTRRKRDDDDKMSKADIFEEGDKVEARFRGRSKWFPGRIKRINRDGSYDIKYEDGDTEEGVDPSMVRRPGGDDDDRQKTPKTKDDDKKSKDDVFEEGDKVDARFRGRSKWFPGRIKKVNHNGTYDIKYEDGDTEESVDPSLVRRPEGDKDDDRRKRDDDGKKSKDDVFEEGDKVEARFRGRSKWFPGRIKRVNRDGTYDIKYEDGDTEEGVDPSMVRRTGSDDDEDRRKTPRTKDDDKKSKGDAFEEGDKVEARWNKGKIWIRGLITRVNRDGTYAVRYEDGNREQYVDSEYIRVASSPKARSSSMAESKEDDNGRRKRSSSPDAKEDSHSIRQIYFDALHLEMWKTDGLIPRELVAKLVPLAETTSKFAQLLRAFYEKDDNDKGIVTEDDFVEVLGRFKVKVSDKDVERLWRCFNFQKDGKVRYWDILEFILCECEGEDLPDVHYKFIRSLQHKFGKNGSNKVHSELLATFQVHDRRGRGFVPVEVFDKWLHNLGLYLEKLERKVLLQRFSGSKSGTVEYEPLIFWAASGVDWRRLKRKVAHVLPLAISEEVRGLFSHHHFVSTRLIHSLLFVLNNRKLTTQTFLRRWIPMAKALSPFQTLKESSVRMVFLSRRASFVCWSWNTKGEKTV